MEGVLDSDSKPDRVDSEPDTVAATVVDSDSEPDNPVEVSYSEPDNPVEVSYRPIRQKPTWTHRKPIRVEPIHIRSSAFLTPALSPWLPPGLLCASLSNHGLRNDVPEYILTDILRNHLPVTFRLPGAADPPVMHGMALIEQGMKSCGGFYIGITEHPARRAVEHLESGRQYTRMTVFFMGANSTESGNVEDALVTRAMTKYGQLLCDNRDHVKKARRSAAGRPHFTYIAWRHSSEQVSPVIPVKSSQTCHLHRRVF